MRVIKEHTDVDGTTRWIIYENDQSVSIHLSLEEAEEEL